MYRIVSSRGDGNGCSVGSGGRDWRVSFFSEWCVVLCLLLQIGWPGRFLFPGDPDRHVCYFCFQAELIGSCCSSWRLLVLPGFQCAFSHSANACGMGRVSLAPGTAWRGCAGSTSRKQAAGSMRSSLCSCIFPGGGNSLGLFHLFIWILILHCDAQVLAAADAIPVAWAWFGLGLHCQFHISLVWPVSITTLLCAVFIVLAVLDGDNSPIDLWEDIFSSATHLSDCTSGFVLRLAIFATFQLTQHWRPFRWVADGVLRLECCRFASNFCCFAKHDILSSHQSQRNRTIRGCAQDLWSFEYLFAGWPLGPWQAFLQIGSPRKQGISRHRMQRIFISMGFLIWCRIFRTVLRTVQRHGPMFCTPGYNPPTAVNSQKPGHPTRAWSCNRWETIQLRQAADGLTLGRTIKLRTKTPPHHYDLEEKTNRCHAFLGTQETSETLQIPYICIYYIFVKFCCPLCLFHQSS